MEMTLEQLAKEDPSREIREIVDSSWNLIRQKKYGESDVVLRRGIAKFPDDWSLQTEAGVHFSIMGNPFRNAEIAGVYFERAKHILLSENSLQLRGWTLFTHLLGNYQERNRFVPLIDTMISGKKHYPKEGALVYCLIEGVVDIARTCADDLASKEKVFEEILMEKTIAPEKLQTYLFMWGIALHHAGDFKGALRAYSEYQKCGGAEEKIKYYSARANQQHKVEMRDILKLVKQ